MSTLSIALRDQVLALFQTAYGASDKSKLIVASAPGRVNLIGEHTDYNDGFVMPMAIERETFVVGRANGLNKYRLVSANAADAHSSHLSSSSSSPSAPHIYEFDVEALLKVPASAAEAGWHAYLRGAVAQYAKEGRTIPFFDAAVAGNVPLGGGLSSSASLEVATTTFVDALLGITTDPKKKALMAQKAEHEFAHVPCGIMDQFISSCGEKDAAMLLDCRTQNFRSVKFTDPSVAVLITNSNVKHALGSGEYAKRRAQCEEAVRGVQKLYPVIKSLRDTTIAQLREAQAHMSPVAFARATHVIGEIVRTTEAADALDAGQYERFGKLMVLSHVSLKNDYEVSCEELDTLVDIALCQPGVYGSRMTGGGFGGCTVTLCDAARVNEIDAAIKAAYAARSSKQATSLLSRPCQGAHLHQL